MPNSLSSSSSSSFTPLVCRLSKTHPILSTEPTSDNLNSKSASIGSNSPADDYLFSDSESIGSTETPSDASATDSDSIGSIETPSDVSSIESDSTGSAENAYDSSVSESLSVVSPEPVEEIFVPQSLASFKIPPPRLNTPIIIKGSAEYPEIQRTIERVRNNYSVDNYSEKLAILEALCRKFPTCYVCWLEWSRVENLFGDFKKAAMILKEGIEYLPQNETLLEKVLKAYERLWCPDEVTRYTLQLLSIGSQRGLRSGVEGIIMLARMGRRHAANALFCEVMATHEVEPALHVDFLRYLFRSHSISEGNRILKMLISAIPHHAPIWFFKLQEDERAAMMGWSEGNLAQRLCVESWLAFFAQVKQNITNDLLWKITSNIAQAILHATTHVRMWLNQHPSVSLFAPRADA